MTGMRNLPDHRGRGRRSSRLGPPSSNHAQSHPRLALSGALRRTGSIRPRHIRDHALLPLPPPDRRLAPPHAQPAGERAGLARARAGDPRLYRRRGGRMAPADPCVRLALPSTRPAAPLRVRDDRRARDRDRVRHSRTARGERHLGHRGRTAASRSRKRHDRGRQDEGINSGLCPPDRTMGIPSAGAGLVRHPVAGLAGDRSRARRRPCPRFRGDPVLQWRLLWSTDEAVRPPAREVRAFQTPVQHPLVLRHCRAACSGPGATRSSSTSRRRWRFTRERRRNCRTATRTCGAERSAR